MEVTADVLKNDTEPVSYTHLAVYKRQVYACVRILSEAIAGLPLHMYRYKEDGGKEKAIDLSLIHI